MTAAAVTEVEETPIREEPVMARYWYSFTPLLFVLTVTVLALPWLGLIAVFLVTLIALAALGALVWGAIVVPQMAVRSVGRRLRVRSVLSGPPSDPEGVER